MLAMGVSHGPPATGRAQPPMLHVVPGSDSHTAADHCISRLLTLLPVQEMLKNLSVVFSIFHKQLSVLKQMNLSSNFSSVSTGSQKSPQPSIFHLKQVQRICSECHYFCFLYSCFSYILDFSPKSQLFSLVLSLWFYNKEADDEARSYQMCGSQRTRIEVLVLQYALLAKPFLSL